MKVLLKVDVDNLGYAGEVHDVAGGYGRNYLIPQGMAVLATPSAKKVLAENLRQKAHKEKQAIDAAEKVAEALKGLEIKIPAKVGEADKLFGSVTNIDLSAALEKEGHSIDKKYISIKGGSIKRAGPYEAEIRLHREVQVDFGFEVVAEQK